MHCSKLFWFSTFLLRKAPWEVSFLIFSFCVCASCIIGEVFYVFIEDLINATDLWIFSLIYSYRSKIQSHVLYIFILCFFNFFIFFSYFVLILFCIFLSWHSIFWFLMKLSGFPLNFLLGNCAFQFHIHFILIPLQYFHLLIVLYLNYIFNSCWSFSPGFCLVFRGNHSGVDYILTPSL